MDAPLSFIMTRAIVLLLGILFFRAALPRRERRTNTTITPYGSVFDVDVPAELACSELCSTEANLHSYIRVEVAFRLLRNSPGTGSLSGPDFTCR